MGVATFLSRIFGLVREQVFAYLFGAGHATDAFNIAFRIPNLLRDLFAEGAMSAAFVPTFVRVREEKGEVEAWRLAGRVFRVLLWGISGLTVIGIVTAPWLVQLYASAYQDVPGKFELTVTLTREIYPFFPLVVLAAAYMGVLNACRVFFIPAFASALFNIFSVAIGVALSFIVPRYGRHPIEGMALGVVAGGLVQAFSQLPALRRKGYRFPRTPAEHPWFKDPYLKRMLWLMVPGTLGLAATQINILINSVLATSAGPGAVSWLNYAFRMIQFPIGIFGVSFAAATLPLFSKHWVGGQWQSASNSLNASLRSVLAINLPASAGLAFLSGPIIQMIFEYGRFSATDTQATATAIIAYSVGLSAYSAVKVIVPVFYAMGTTTIPVVSSVASVLTNLILNLIFIRVWGFAGLALGTSCTAILNAVFLLWAFRRKLREKGAYFEYGELMGFVVKVTALSLLMGVACFGFHQLLMSFTPDSVAFRVVRVGLSVSLGGFVVVAFGRLLGIPELGIQRIIEPIHRVRKKLFSR